MGFTDFFKDKPKEDSVNEIDNTNPFNDGVTYDAFLKELGNKNINSFLKDKCSKKQIEWIKVELKQFKNK